MTASIARIFSVVVAALCGAGLSPAVRLSAADGPWKMDVELRQQLDAEVGLQWAGVSLRDALSNVASTYQVAIFLDRRVDPDQLITFSVQEVPLREALAQLAARLGLGVSRVGSVVYMGPQPLAAKLATLSAVRNQDISRMPPDDARRLARLQASSWPALSTPKDLVSELAAAEQVRIQGADKTPHDLWPAADLPPLSFADRLTLLLAGFDATFQVVDGQPAVQVTSIPEQVLLEKEYRAPGNTTDWPAELGERYPQAKISQQGRRILVSASWEDHEEIARLIRGEKVTRRAPADAGGALAYTLTIEDKPLGEVARQLAAALKLQIQFDPRIDAEAQERLISIKVDKASRDELWRAILSPAGLSFKIDGQSLLVTPAEPPP